MQAKKTDQIDALLTDINDAINNLLRDFLSKNNRTKFTVQNLTYLKTRKNNDDRSLLDRIKTNCELKRRHNGYDGCNEDNDAFAEGTNSYTHSSLSTSISSSGIGTEHCTTSYTNWRRKSKT